MRPVHETGGTPNILRLTKVDVFHRIIRTVSKGDMDVAAALHQLFGIPQSTTLHEEDWTRMKGEFSHSMSTDVGSKVQGDRLTERVFAKLEGNQFPMTIRDLIERIDSVYSKIAAEFSDLLIDFVHTSLTISRNLGVSETVFLSRDAVPFYVIASELTASAIEHQPIALLDLNRRMIPDYGAPPFKHQSSDDMLVKRYIDARLASRQRIAIVDTGLYGTLIGAVLEIRLIEDLVVVFFASKNPDIFGYLNGLSSDNLGSPVPLSAIGEACCDVVETWPKLYGPSQLLDDGQVVWPVARPTDVVAAAASLSLCKALAERARSINLEALSPCSLSDLPLEAPLPCWEHAEAWLSMWRKGPISPME